MNNTDEQTLPWNQFWNFIAKNGHSKAEAEEAMKKVEEALSKYVLEELKSEKYFSLQLDWYHTDEIPNLYRVYVNFAIYLQSPKTVKIQKVEPELVPLPSYIYKLTGGTKPPNPPGPGGPRSILALRGNPVFERSIADNQIAQINSTITISIQNEIEK